MHTPVIQLNFYLNDVTTMTRYMGNGSITHPITAAQIASLMDKTRTRIASGWLPANVLSWSIEPDNCVRCVTHFPATTRMIQIKDDARWQIPLPPTVLVGNGSYWHIYAIQSDTMLTPKTPLYHCPAPNVSKHDGVICRGNTPFPRAAPDTMDAAYTAFWDSQFNHHWVSGKCASYPNNVVDLWQTLDGADLFPDDELLRCGTLNDIIK